MSSNTVAPAKHRAARNFRQAAAAVSLVFVLATGCTGAQMEAARMQKVTTDTAAAGRACDQNIAGNPDYAALVSKTVLAPDAQYSLQMLNDSTTPNKQEVSLLYRVYGDMQECRKIALDGAAKTHPLILVTLIEAYAEADKLWGEATSGHLTWGKFNEGRKNITTQARTKLAQADMQIDSQLQNQHQFELEQRQRAAAAMQQWAYQQQLLANQHQTQTINCMYFGTTASCTSY